MRRAPRLVPFFAALALPAAAHAEQWNCGDRIVENGLQSFFGQSYFSPFQPPQPIIGPYQVVSGGGFYTGWYLRYKKVDAPFLPPDSMSINLDVPAPVARGTALFERAGAAPVRVRFGGSGVPAGPAPFVHLLIEDQDRIDALLAARDWSVTLLDARGEKAARVDWRFPLDIAGLRALHARHVAAMLAKEKDIPGQCERDLTEEVI